MAGEAGSGELGNGAIWHGRSSQAWQGSARHGEAPQAWLGVERLVEERHGPAGTARQGLALLGAAWSGWRSWAWLRTKGGGISCPPPFF